MLSYILNKEIDTECKKKHILHKYRRQGDIVSFSLLKLNKKDLNIVGYFKNKKLASDNDNNIVIQSMNNDEYRYKLFNKGSVFTQGYVNVGNDDYVGYINTKPFALLCVFIASVVTLFVICGVLFNHCNRLLIGDPYVVSTGEGITDIEDMLHGKSKSHEMSVPQFSSLFIYKGTYVPLVNLPQNDVMLMYEVYDTDNKLVFSSEKALVPNSEDKWYLDGYKTGAHTFVVKASKVDVDMNKGNTVTFNTTIHILD